ncbi:MAG: SCO family protein [Polaromonas sp.]
MKMNFPMQPDRRRAVKILAGGAVLSMTAGLLMGCSPDKPQFKSIDLTGADYAQGFSLTDHNGQLRTLKDFAGKVVVVFFGFTQCPDVCPSALAELAQVKQLLGPNADKLQAIFITLDPERDTPELLKAYMANFDPGFLALRPTPEQLPQVGRDFKIYYKKVEGKTPGSYTMDHSAGSYVFDTKGRIRLYNRYGAGADVLASDIQLLLKTG